MFLTNVNTLRPTANKSDKVHKLVLKKISIYPFNYAIKILYYTKGLPQRKALIL
jgi:hypothetical protein